MGYNFADHCYILENGLWSQFAKLSEKRRNLASVSLTRNGKNALFVTGGRDDDIYHKQTTEFIYSNGDVEQGPDLPGTGCLTLKCAIVNGSKGWKDQ